MVRIFIYLALAWVAYRLLRWWIRLPSAADEPEIGHSGVAPKERESELIKDPHCGVFFLKQRGVKATVNGRTHYFCSAACRDAYLERGESH